MESRAFWRNLRALWGFGKRDIEVVSKEPLYGGNSSSDVVDDYEEKQYAEDLVNINITQQYLNSFDLNWFQKTLSKFNLFGDERLYF